MLRLTTTINMAKRYLPVSAGFMIFAALNCPSPSYASPAAKLEAENTPWYHIDLAIYRQPRRLSQSEQWLPAEDIRLNFPAHLMVLDEPDTETQTTLLDDGVYNAFQNLPNTAPSFAQATERMRRHGAFELLYRASWRQPVGSEQDAVPILVQAGQRTEQYAELEGSISLHVARFLHIRTDLAMLQYERRSQHAFNQFDWLSTDLAAPFLLGDADQVIFTYADDFVESSSARRDEEKPVVVPTRGMQLRTSRRMRSGEIHYIDHPLIGVLVKITPTDAPRIPQTIEQTD